MRSRGKETNGFISEESEGLSAHTCGQLAPRFGALSQLCLLDHGGWPSLKITCFVFLALFLTRINYPTHTAARRTLEAGVGVS